MKPRSQSGFTLVELLVVIVIIGILAAVLLPQIARAIRNARVTGCASNLKSLWSSQFNYAAQYGRPDGRMPESLGSDFILALQRTPRPMIDRYEPFFCPYSDDEVGPGRTSYRGPALPIRALSVDDPISADKEGNHGAGQGGSVLTGRGDVSEFEITDPVWIRARTTTKE